jgi:hypothetical protein
MNILPTQCPLCDGEITVTRIHCRACDTVIEGRFSGGPFSDLTHEQLDFVEIFVRNEGKIKRMEEELGLSYPTIRNRLYEVIRAMGYEPGAVEDEGLSEEERQSILEQLNTGEITAEQAMELLRES